MSNVFEPTAAVGITITGCRDGAGVALSVPAGIPTPVWTCSDSTVLPLAVATNGLSATGTSLKAGTVTVNVTCAATTGPITGSATIAFTAGVPVTFVLNVVQLAPPPPPPPGP
jgi:hypothetical protein